MLRADTHLDDTSLSGCLRLRVRVRTRARCTLQKLEEADDDSYMNAAWADSNALKNKLQGTGSIGFGKLR